MDALDGWSEVAQAQRDTKKEADADADASSSVSQGLIRSIDVTDDGDRAGPRSPFEITFPSSVIWGLMGCATAFATTLVRERNSGTMLRLRISPLGRARILIGKGLACFVAGCTASMVLLLIGVTLLGVGVDQPLMLVAAVAAAAACFTGFMMLLSVLGKTESAVAGGSWILMMPLAMLGGGMIPLVAMPEWMLTLSNISPFKWAVLAIEGAVWRGFGWEQILMPIGILLGVAIVLFGVGVGIMRARSG